MFNLPKLENIIDKIKPDDIFNKEDKLLITEMVADLITEYIAINPLDFYYENFNLVLLDSIYNVAYIQIKNAYLDNISDELLTLVEKTINKYFTYILPNRSYSIHTVKYTPNINSIKDKLHYLTNVPQPDQRTNEWYIFRHECLTASSIWKAFSTQGNINQLIYNKCIPLDVNKYSNINLESPLHWGQKYEDVSIQWYENSFKTKVDDFGCIKHKNIPYLAASPDGINTDEASDRYGRMVEVKNIVNRKINQIPKFEYWIQMQVQMEVCELNECDFLETRFIEYDSYNDFINDGSFNYTKNNKYKGVCVLFFDCNSQPIYEYQPWNCSHDDFITWNNNILDKHKNNIWFKNIYWYLDEVSVVLVPRNKLWFSAAKLILDKLWETITYEKKHGFQHRQPKKRIASVNTNPSKCLIDTTNMVFNIKTD